MSRLRGAGCGPRRPARAVARRPPRPGGGSRQRSSATAPRSVTTTRSTPARSAVCCWVVVASPASRVAGGRPQPRMPGLPPWPDHEFTRSARSAASMSAAPIRRACGAEMRCGSPLGPTSSSTPAGPPVIWKVMTVIGGHGIPSASSAASRSRVCVPNTGRPAGSTIPRLRPCGDSPGAPPPRPEHLLHLGREGPPRAPDGPRAPGAPAPRSLRSTTRLRSTRGPSSWPSSTSIASASAHTAASATDSRP